MTHTRDLIATTLVPNCRCGVLIMSTLYYCFGSFFCFVGGSIIPDYLLFLQDICQFNLINSVCTATSEEGLPPVDVTENLAFWFFGPIFFEIFRVDPVTGLFCKICGSKNGGTGKRMSSPKIALKSLSFNCQSINVVLSRAPKFCHKPSLSRHSPKIRQH